MHRFMYGTAWKEGETKRLVGLALTAGFRAIDTANQRKHYFEEAVGEALAESPVAREELFLQTKFTFQRGQDHRLPYDPKASLEVQVKQSVASSLEHLRTTWLDSYVLHGPWGGIGLTREDVEVWETMEELHGKGTLRALGISNCSAEQLEKLVARAKVRPSFVQNRCYASHGWDCEVRAVCRAHGIVYQGFSLLTANRREVAAPAFQAIAVRVGLTPSQLVFRYALDVGMLPLTGTSSVRHMREDLAVVAKPALSPDDIAAIEAVAPAE